MNHISSVSRDLKRLTFLASLLLLSALLYARTVSAQSSSPDRWLHVRVTSTDSHNETVKVNVPLEFAEKVLPAINKDRLHNGKLTLDGKECDGIDIHAVLDAVRGAKDGEFVTVQSDENDVRVAKQGGYLIVHVRDLNSRHSHSHRVEPSKDAPSKDAKDKPVISDESRVEVKVPMQVVDALFSAGKDELDLVAGLRALSTHGDAELVTVKDNENTVRVWLDSKNITD
jgi:hypothetical protein